MAEWKVLAQSIYEHASRHEVARVIVTEHGTKYLVEGSIVTPDERYPFVRTVWLIETGTEVPRFITAYPIKERSE